MEIKFDQQLPHQNSALFTRLPIGMRNKNTTITKCNALFHCHFSNAYSTLLKIENYHTFYNANYGTIPSRAVLLCDSLKLSVK